MASYLRRFKRPRADGDRDHTQPRCPKCRETGMIKQMSGTWPTTPTDWYCGVCGREWRIEASVDRSGASDE